MVALLYVNAHVRLPGLSVAQNFGQRIPDGARGRLDAEIGRQGRGNVIRRDGTTYRFGLQAGAREDHRYIGIIPPRRTMGRGHRQTIEVGDEDIRPAFVTSRRAS